MDSGTTHHVTINKDVLSKCYKLSDLEKYKVQLPTGAKVDISHMWEAYIFKDRIVRYALFVSNLRLKYHQCPTSTL